MKKVGKDKRMESKQEVELDGGEIIGGIFSLIIIGLIIIMIYLAYLMIFRWR